MIMINAFQDILFRLLATSKDLKGFASQKEKLNWINDYANSSNYSGDVSVKVHLESISDNALTSLEPWKTFAIWATNQEGKFFDTLKQLEEFARSKDSFSRFIATSLLFLGWVSRAGGRLSPGARP